MQLVYLYHVIFAGIFFCGRIWVQENRDNYANAFNVIIVNFSESLS